LAFLLSRIINVDAEIMIITTNTAMATLKGSKPKTDCSFGPVVGDAGVSVGRYLRVLAKTIEDSLFE
jgi:hypothetical protein